jgi:hypothetical protein
MYIKSALVAWKHWKFPIIGGFYTPHFRGPCFSLKVKYFFKYMIKKILKFKNGKSNIAKQITLNLNDYVKIINEELQ